MEIADLELEDRNYRVGDRPDVLISALNEIYSFPICVFYFLFPIFYFYFKLNLHRLTRAGKISSF